MASLSTHLAAVLTLLACTQEGVKSHAYRTGRGRGGGRNYWPAAFMGNDVDTGAFRPFHGSPRGGGISTSGLPLVDVFQDFFGDLKKVARELSDHSADISASTPPHEVFELPDSVTVNVDLPGCKKQDVDAQISQDTGVRTLTITAVRKKLIRDEPVGDDLEPPSSRSDEASPPDAADAAASVNEPPSPSFTEHKFKLSFRIGDGIDASGIRGTMEDGVLTLVLPRIAPEPPAQPIDIPIDPPAGEGQGRSSKGGEGFARSRGLSAESSTDTHISLS